MRNRATLLALGAAAMGAMSHEFGKQSHFGDPIFTPKRHTVQSYRSQQKKASKRRNGRK